MFSFELNRWNFAQALCQHWCPAAYTVWQQCMLKTYSLMKHTDAFDLTIRSCSYFFLNGDRVMCRTCVTNHLRHFIYISEYIYGYRYNQTRLQFFCFAQTKYIRTYVRSILLSSSLCPSQGAMPPEGFHLRAASSAPLLISAMTWQGTHIESHLPNLPV